MTGREKVLTSMNHRQPDSVPIDFGGHRNSGIMAISYRKLREHLMLPPKSTRVYDMIQQLAVIDEDILDIFEVDTVEIGRAFLTENTTWKQWVLPDGTECLIPPSAHRLLERLLEIRMEQLDTLLGAVGPFVDIVLFGDDLGMQSGPLISPQMYREFLKSRHQTLWARAKKLANVKVMLHSCGGIEPLLEDLIEAGLDAINPVQISARGMEPKRLKKICRNRLCLWGGRCDTQSILECLGRNCPRACDGTTGNFVARRRFCFPASSQYNGGRAAPECCSYVSGNR